MNVFVPLRLADLHRSHTFLILSGTRKAKSALPDKLAYHKTRYILE